MTVAKLYKKQKSPTQPGKAGNVGKWILEFKQEHAKFIDPIMGWTGSDETNGQLRIKFDCFDDAVNYAKKENIDFKVFKERKSLPIIKSYSDNFQ